MSKKIFKFNNVSEAPDGVMNLSKDGQKQWLEIANALLLAGDNKDYAISRAWQSIKEGWKKNDDGEWQMPMPMIETPQDMPMFSKGYSLEDATKEIKGVQVFETGNWNGSKYTEKDLEEMVNNFGIFEAPLKIGHDAKQKLAGMPAVGWITKLYKKGKKLYADIQGIPKTVYELIKKGAYKKRSAELYYNVVDGTGKICNNVFGGLALLGAELPAINTLEDVVALYENQSSAKDKKIILFDIEGGTDMKKKVFNGTEIIEVNEADIVDGKIGEVDVTDVPEGATVVDGVLITPTEKTQEEKDAELAKAELEKAELAKAEAEKAEAEAKILADEKAKAEAEIEKIKAENLSLKKEKETAEIKEFMKSIEKKIPPVVSSMVFEALSKSDNATKVEFALNDKKVENTNREFLMKLFSSMPDMAILKNVTDKGDDKELNKQHRAVMEANKIVAKDGLKFSEALIKVYSLYPDLVEQAKPISQ